MFNAIADFALRIKQVAELPGANRTDLDTCGIPSRVLPCPLDAERAFFNNTFFPGTVTEIVDLRIEFLLQYSGFTPVKVSCSIGTCSHAVPATYAPVVINYHNTVTVFPCSLGRAYLYAGRVFTLLALHWHIKLFLFRDLVGIVVLISFFKDVDPFFTFIEF